MSKTAKLLTFLLVITLSSYFPPAQSQNNKERIIDYLIPRSTDEMFFKYPNMDALEITIFKEKPGGITMVSKKVMRGVKSPYIIKQEYNITDNALILIKSEDNYEEKKIKESVYKYIVIPRAYSEIVKWKINKTNDIISLQECESKFENFEYKGMTLKGLVIKRKYPSRNDGSYTMETYAKYLGLIHEMHISNDNTIKILKERINFNAKDSYLSNLE